MHFAVVDGFTPATGSATESSATEGSATEGSSGHSESQNEGSASSNVQKETSKASSKGGGEQLLLFED